MIESPHIVTTDPLPAAVIHLTIPRKQIDEVVGPAMKEVVDVVTAQGVGPAGPFFMHHLKMDKKKFDFELGVPVRAKVSPSGRVKAGQLPGARVVRTIYHGPYEKLYDAWREFGERMKAEGLTPASHLWETYLSGPESGNDSSEFQTELNQPLVG